MTVTSTASELNLLNGVTATAADLNSLIVAVPGQSEAGKALLPDTNGDLTLNGDLIIGNTKTLTVPKDALHLGSDAVTATAAEINILDGVDPGLTAAHLNPVKDFTGDWAALDVLSGVTATNDELNMLDIAQVGMSEASKAVTADANNKGTIAQSKGSW